MAQRTGLVLLLYWERIFKLFITLNFLKFLPLGGPPNTNFFTPWGFSDPTLRTYGLVQGWTTCVRLGSTRKFPPNPQPTPLRTPLQTAQGSVWELYCSLSICLNLFRFGAIVRVSLMTRQSYINAGLKSQLLRISQRKNQCEY